MNIRELPRDERIRLVEDLWDSIAADHDDVPVSEAQRLELDQRLQAYRVSGLAGDPAAVVIERIRTQV